MARDMDEIRKALGVEQISYFGFSYGSVPSIWYATLSPDAIRAMVADGADNPIDRADTQEAWIEKIVVFGKRLRNALMACNSADCLIYNDGYPIGYYNRAAEKFHQVNSAAGNVPSAVLLGLVTPLHNEDDWPGLWQDLYELNEGDDPTILLKFVRGQLDYDPTAPNFTAHVNCLDEQVLYSQLDRATRLEGLVW